MIDDRNKRIGLWMFIFFSQKTQEEAEKHVILRTIRVANITILLYIKSTCSYTYTYFVF